MPSCSLSMSMSLSSKSDIRSAFLLSNMNVTVSPESSACKNVARVSLEHPAPDADHSGTEAAA